MDRLFPKKCPFAWGIWIPSSNTCFLGPTRVHNANVISIGSAVFCKLTIVTYVVLRCGLELTNLIKYTSRYQCESFGTFFREKSRTVYLEFNPRHYHRGHGANCSSVCVELLYGHCRPACVCDLCWRPSPTPRVVVYRAMSAGQRTDN